MGFYNPLSPSADIGGGISDLLSMLMQYMMIQKMYPQQGASGMSRQGWGSLLPQTQGTMPQQGMPQTGGMGGLDTNSIMQLLMQLFSQRTPQQGLNPYSTYPR